ncbi:hypothetical protein [Halorussus sp. AFM4]|uniref:hypothetical protein n=1 Tax=Halorussus sp. AFM4 TaxID=3421651 RepID=UPI003EBA722B
MLEEQTVVVYRCWCEHEDCDWERRVEERDIELAQRCSAAAMAGHGIAEGHYRTKRYCVESGGD